MPAPLFRQEVLRRQGERLWGELLLCQPLSFRILTALLTVLITAALGFLAANDYVRKQSVNGTLVPDQGLINVLAPAGGQLAVLAVTPDQPVALGAPLFTLQLDHTLTAAGGLTAGLLQALSQQQAVLRQRHSDKVAELALARQGLGARQVFLQARLHELRLLAANTEAQLALQQKALGRARQLAGEGLLASADVDMAEARFLQQRGAVLELALQQAETAAESSALDTEVESNRLAGRQQLRQLEAELAELEKQRLRLAAEQVTTVTAPVAGKVTAVLQQRGMAVAAQETVLSLLPRGAVLVAELLLPSNAIGFVEPGQRVTLRYAAFPYQKFGVQHGSISSVPGSAEPGPGGQLLYRVKAVLERQSVTAYGSEQPLRPGMALSADIELDRRSLLEWLLEPLFSIRG